jgi:5,10-methylene-tetrahydrofolate dehydrogenase/methenyl tetrahydrofolate cyclohydrolase
LSGSGAKDVPYRLYRVNPGVEILRRQSIRVTPKYNGGPMNETPTSIAARLEHYRNLFDLTGKNAVVLGAASGIGKASAEALAALGANVVCADKYRESFARTDAEIGTCVK